MLFASWCSRLFFLACAVALFVHTCVPVAAAEDPATVVWVALDTDHAAAAPLRRIVKDYLGEDPRNRVAARFLTEAERADLSAVVAGAALPPDLIVARASVLRSLYAEGVVRAWDVPLPDTPEGTYDIALDTLASSATLVGQPLCAAMELLYVNLDMGATSATEPGSWDAFVAGRVGTTVRGSSGLWELGVAGTDFEYATYSTAPGLEALGRRSVEVVGVADCAARTHRRNTARGFVAYLLEKQSVLKFWRLGGCLPVRAMPETPGLLETIRLRGPWLDTMSHSAG